MSLPVSGPRILLVATPGDVASDAAQQLAQHGYASVSRAAGIVDVPAMLLLAKADVALLHVEQADAAEFTLTLDAFRAQCALPLVLLVGAASGKPSAQVELPASVSSLEKVCLPFDARTLHSAIALAIHKHAAAATLEEMEQRLMLARAGSSAGAWEWDLVKNESYYSPRWFEMFGYAPNEFAVTQDQWRSMIHPDDLAGATAVLKGVFRGNAPGFDREVRMRHRAGHYVPILSRGVVIRDAAGRVMRIAGTTSDLSVRKKIEHDLELQRQFATRIIDTVEQGLTVTDAEGRFEFVNPAYARMCGVEPAELIGKLPEEVSAPGTHDAYANARAERRNGKTTTYESRLQRPDGHVVDVLVTGAPRSLDGQFAGAIAAVTDLTERKRIEAALQATMNELRLITNAVPGLISRIDRNLRFVFANEGYIKRFERPLAEIVGRTIREVVGEDSFRQAEPNITRVLAGQAVSWENTYQSSSGGTRFALVKFVPDFDAEKNVIGFFAIGLDVTDRKLAEAKLRESDEHFRVLIERTPEAIVVHRDKRFLYLNPAALALLGASSAQELIGKSIMDIIHPDFHQLLDERLRKGEQNLPVAPVAEFKLIRLDGGVRYAEVQGTMITYDGVPAAHAVMRDITPRKEAEAMRASLETQLRESQKMEAIGTLAGGIAHDFNNILATILGNTELARQDVLANPKAQESLDEIRKAGTRARDLVQQILSFSRRQPTERKLLALAPIIDEAVRLLRATLLARITLDVRYESGVPMVFADATQLQQVVINLATNAMHAMQGGPGRIDVRLDSVMLDQASAASDPSLAAMHAKHPGTTVRIAVSDNGRGMDAATIRRIFEPFFTTKAVDEGTGLGLSVVHGIVHEHGGTVLAVSEPGRGSTFTVYLPAAARDADATPRSAPRTRPASMANIETTRSGANANVTAKASRHILYLDDDESLVFLVKRLLERRGYRISGFTDQHEALAAIRAAPGGFDLVVSDYNMPGLSGLDVAREVRSIRANLPVALASGFIDEALRAQAGGAGVLELIFKASAVEDFCEAFVRLASADR